MQAWRQSLKEPVEDPQLIRQSTHKARKEHECAGCFKPIKRGEIYVREVYSNCELLMSDAVHLHCKRVEKIAGAEGWYNAFSGDKIRAVSFSSEDKQHVADTDQDAFIAVWGAG